MKVRFLNSKGGTLVGYLYKPIKKTDKALIFCHGFSGFKEQFKLWADYFSFRGFVTLAFDFTGNGESDGFLTQGTLSQEISDISSAIDFLKKNYGIKKVGIVAHSMGSAVSVLSASKYPEIKCLVLLAPLTVLKGKPYKEFANEMADLLDSKGLCDIVNCKKMRSLDTAFFRDVSNHDVLKSARKVKVPTLIIHGDSDSVVNIKEGELLYKALKIKNKKFHPLTGIDHDFARHRLKISDVIFDWFRKYLK